MLIDINDGSKVFDEQCFDKFYSLIKNGTAFTGIPLEFRDSYNNLLLNEDLEGFIKKIRILDTIGYLSILLVLDTNHLITPELNKKVEDLCNNYINVFVKFVFDDNSDIENIRELIENVRISNKLFFEYRITNNDFDLTKYINILFKHTPNNNLILSLDNNLQKDYKVIAESIIKSNKYRRKKHVALEFSCNFVNCMFSNEQMGDLFRSPMIGIDFFCKPRVIIKPNLDIHYCDHENSFKLHMDNVKSIKGLYEQMEVIRDQRDSFVYEECEKCWYNEKLCSGGCMF